MSGIFRGAGTGGDVVGPASSTDMAIARYDGTSGKLLDETAALLDDNGIPILPNMPYLVAARLSAAANATGDGTVYTIVWDSVVTDRGSNYNNATGEYTVPYSGLYSGTDIITLSGLTSSHTNCIVTQVNSSSLNTVLAQFNPFAQSASGTLTFTLGGFTEWSASSVITTTVEVSGGTKVVGVAGSRVIGLIHRTN